MTTDQLKQMRAWADAKLATGEEPPWAWYQYMKLRETLDAILAGIDAVKQTESSPESEPRQESGPRLVVSNTQPSNAQPHQEIVPVLMPM